jgi:hypothetical protein
MRLALTPASSARDAGVSDAYVLEAAGAAPDRIRRWSASTRGTCRVRSIPTMAAYGALGVRFTLVRRR